MNIKYLMLKRIIERKNPNINKGDIEISLLDQLSLDNISKDQYNELLELFNNSLVTEDKVISN